MHYISTHEPISRDAIHRPEERRRFVRVPPKHSIPAATDDCFRAQILCLLPAALKYEDDTTIQGLPSVCETCKIISISSEYHWQLLELFHNCRIVRQSQASEDEIGHQLAWPGENRQEDIDDFKTRFSLIRYRGRSSANGERTGRRVLVSSSAGLTLYAKA